MSGGYTANSAYYRLKHKLMKLFRYAFSITRSKSVNWSIRDFPQISFLRLTRFSVTFIKEIEAFAKKHIIRISLTSYIYLEIIGNYEALNEIELMDW